HGAHHLLSGFVVIQTQIGRAKVNIDVSLALLLAERSSEGAQPELLDDLLRARFSVWLGFTYEHALAQLRTRKHVGGYFGRGAEVSRVLPNRHAQRTGDVVEAVPRLVEER